MSRRKPQIRTEEALERLCLGFALFCVLGLSLYALGVHL